MGTSHKNVIVAVRETAQAQLTSAERKRKRIVNPKLTDEDAAALPPCVGSHDMGTKNYTFVILVPKQLSPNARQESKFQCPFERIVRWKKYILEGEQIMEYSTCLVSKLEKEPIHRQNRIRDVYCEAQIAPKAKHMLGISATMLSYFKTRQLVTGSPFPERFCCVGAQSKFSYFLLGTPEGDENYANRKRLSRLIVEYLLTEWNKEGEAAVPKQWLEFYTSKLITGDDKQDDYADCILQGITEMLMAMGIAPPWIALAKLYAWLLRADTHFAGPGKNNWPLAMTAEGENYLTALMRKVDRELQAAIRKKEKLVARLTGLKRKKTPAEEKQLMEDADRELAAKKAASESVYNGLKVPIGMIGARAHNKEAREIVRTKERQEAEERAAKFATLNDAMNAEIGAKKKRASASSQDKIPYLMQLENEAIRRGDEARRAYLASAMGTIDEEVDFEELQDDHEQKKAMEEYQQLMRNKRAKPATDTPGSKN